MSLSVCYLTRNESRLLPRSIQSVAGLASEILVADTGSTDGTAAVAARHGAKVVEFSWDDEFAAGRNFTLGQARGDWILWLNADEALDPATADALRASLTRADVFGWFVRIRHVSQSGQPTGGETADLRLFRRRPDAAFVGRLQPAFTEEFVETIRHEGLKTAPTEVTLLRQIDPSPPTEAKLRFNLRLLDRELADRPGQLRYMIERGQVLLRLDAPRGHAAMAEAVDAVTPHLGSAAPPSVKVQSLLEYVLTADAAVYRGTLTRDEAAERAERWFPRSPLVLFRAAEHWFLRGQVARAAAILERLLDLGRTGAFDRSQPFDPGVVGDDALVNLAACHRALGRLDEAEACYQSLLSSRHFRVEAQRGLAAIAAARRLGR